MWEIVFGILAGIFSVIVLAGFFIPSKIAFSKTTDIAAEKRVIFGYLEDLRKWQQWSQWSEANDAPITCTYEGKERGRGAIMQWKGKKMGSGKMEIKTCVPHKELQIEIIFHNSGFTMQSYFLLTSAKHSTQVTWRMEGRIRRFGIAKFIGLLLPKWMGKDMQTALKILKMLCEERLKP